MRGKKATGKTIGEVEKLTGIPKRKLKYFLEQRLVQPSLKSESGYWLYCDEDIWKAQLGVSVQMEHRPVFYQNEEGENRHVI